jgi:hypothetical protein
MTDDQFRQLCNVYGFAPSRALRELLDKAMEQERERIIAQNASKNQTRQRLRRSTRTSRRLRKRLPSVMRCWRR